MYFDEQAPVSQIASQQKFYDGNLGWLGFNNDGTRNQFGKVMGWHPLFGMATNVIARRKMESQRATDALENQGIAMQRDTSKALTTVNLGIGVAGAMSGNPQLAMQGGVGAVKSLGGLMAAPQGIDNTQPQISWGNLYNQ